MADIQPQFSSQVTADAQGGWELVLPDDLSAGMHTLQAVGEDGSTDEALLYIDRAPQTQVQPPSIFGGGVWVSGGATPVVPPAFAAAMFVFLTAIALLAVNGVRLARKVDREERHRHRHARHAMAACLAALGISFFAGVVVNQSAGTLRGLIPASAPAPAVRASVAGAVVSPFRHEPVAGVDLVAGSLSVRTAEGGRFAFSDIDAGEGLRLTHPSLARALRIRLPGVDVSGERHVNAFPISLLFDARMYNALAYAVDADARAGRGIFAPGDAAAQELDLARVEEDVQARAVDVLVRNRGEEAAYRLVLQDGEWQVQ